MKGEKLALLSGVSEELNAATHLASVIHSASECDSSVDAADIPGALFSLWKRLWEISRDLEQIVDSEYDNHISEARDAGSY